MRVLFIKQDHVSAAGPVAEAFADLGYDVADLLVVPPERFATPDVTVAFPDPAAFDAIVPMGAPWSVYDQARIGSWVGAELAFLRRAASHGVPVLGICFGGQLLARALGARLYRLPEPEIGWVPVSSQHPGLPAGPWLAWHRDAFELPAGARELAVGGASVQAFSYGRHVGLQFHPEATEAITEDWMRGVTPAVSPAQASQLRAGWAAGSARAAADASTLFSAWLDGDLAVAGNQPRSDGTALPAG